MLTKLELTRKVTPDECNWLKKVYHKGDTVYEFYGCTYGAVSPNGVACTENVVNSNPDLPFFELPKDSVKEV